MNPLITELTQLLNLAQGAIWQAGLVFLRCGAMIAILPGLGEQLLSQRIRLASVVLITLIVAPAVSGDPQAALAGFDTAERFTLATIATEVIAGLLLGFLLRLLIMGLQIAGTIIAQSISLAQMFSGTGPEPQPIVTNLLGLAGVALFCAMGGLARSVELLVLSYQIIPPATLLDPGPLARLGIARIARIFALGFSLSAPFVIAALLYNLTLGAINRAMPGLMVTFIGAPALTLGGLLLLTLATPFLLESWQDVVRAALADPFGAW